jgi:ribbon-helix-helix CopG family protein
VEHRARLIRPRDLILAGCRGTIRPPPVLGRIFPAYRTFFDQTCGCPRQGGPIGAGSQPIALTRRAVNEGKPPLKKRSLGLSARLPSIQLTPDLLRELEQAAERQGVTVSAAVRAAIRSWLNDQKQS